MDNVVPMIPAEIPNSKYNVPISLWFVENNHFKSQENMPEIKRITMN
jgi:hypothetical protein